MLNEKQIKERIAELKKEISVFEFVLNSKREGIGRPKGSLKYTEEEINFLKECLNNGLNNKEIITSWNLRFKDSIRADSRSLYNFIQRMGLK